MVSLVAYSPDQARDEQGQFASDGSDQSASQSDEEAKRLYADLLALPPEQRDAYLAGLNPDQLTRLGKFASTGEATDGPIADIRNKTGQAMAKRGLDPKAAGLKSKGGAKKKPAAKKGGKSSGGGSKGGGSKGGGGKSSGGGKKSGGGGSKSGGSKSSSSKPTPKKTAPKTEAKAPAKPPAKPAPPPQVSPIGRAGPGRPGGPGAGPGLPPPTGRRRARPQPVRSSAAPESLADWNAARYAATREDP